MIFFIIYVIGMLVVALSFEDNNYASFEFAERFLFMLFWPVLLVLVPALILIVNSFVYIFDKIFPLRSP